jgi:hypothetical protein
MAESELKAANDPRVTTYEVRFLGPAQIQAPAQAGASFKSRAVMSRKSRKTARRRKWQRRLRPITSPADAMHQALGKFLTEMGRVEFRMLLLMDILNEAPLEALFDEYSGKTFKDKIGIFKKWCDFGGVPDKQKSALHKVYKELEELRPKRNFIVHGETWEGTFKGKSQQPYSVGLVKGNLEYLDEFERAEHGQNVFDVHQVRTATQLCIRPCGRI